AVEIEPGLAIELDQLLQGSHAECLLAVVDGEISYGGITNVDVASDGTHASGSMTGLQADLQLLSVPVVAPNGLGALELGFERVDVAADVSAGGVNCVIDDDETDTDGATDGDTDGATDGDTDGATDGATDGDTDGATDGDTDGATDGDTDGATDGDTDGATDGATDGDTDGATDGDTDGATDGATDGDTDGATDGD